MQQKIKAFLNENAGLWDVENIRKRCGIGSWSVTLSNCLELLHRKEILKMLQTEDLTVNEIAPKINMTRQGVRSHIHILEKEESIFRVGYKGRKNIVYSYRRR